MIDVRYRRAAKARATCEAEEIDAMIEALRANVHEKLGFGSFYEYVESVSDVGGRALTDRVRVAERLDELPAIRAAMRRARRCSRSCGSKSWPRSVTVLTTTR